MGLSRTNSALHDSSNRALVPSSAAHPFSIIAASVAPALSTRNGRHSPVSARRSPKIASLRHQARLRSNHGKQQSSTERRTRKPAHAGGYPHGIVAYHRRADPGRHRRAVPVGKPEHRALELLRSEERRVGKE